MHGSDPQAPVAVPASLLHARRMWAGAWLPWSVLLLGVALSVLMGLVLHKQVDGAAHQRFNAMTDRFHNGIQERLHLSRDTLRALSSVSAVQGGPLSAADLEVWAATRDLRNELPGVRAVSLIQRVERPMLGTFVSQMRAGEAPDFQVRTKGQAPDLYLVRAIEPLASNRKAMGFDIGSDPVRREAIQDAIDSGKPRMSRSVTLVQDDGQRIGFLYLLPLYAFDTPVDTVEQRRSGLVGLVSLPLVVDGLLAGLDDTLHSLAVFDLYEAHPGEPPKLLASTHGASGQAPSVSGRTRFMAERRIPVGGQELLLVLRSTPAFDADAGYGPVMWLALMGMVLSVVAAAAIWFMQDGERRVRALAARMTRDVTDAQREAEQAVRENAALVHTLDQFSMVCVTGADGAITEVNDALCQACGHEREALIGRNPRVLGSGLHDPCFWIDVWQTLLHGKPWVGQISNRTRDGRLYWTQCVIAPFMGDNGQVEKYISIAYDITETHRVQNALKADAERYDLAIDGGTDGLWDWKDVSSKEEWWSPQFYRLLGYEPGEIPASVVTVEELLHPEDRKAVHEAVRRALDAGAPFDVECRFRTKPGPYRWFRARAKVYFDTVGEATRMAGSIQDVHERKQAHATVREQSQRTAAIFSLSPDGFVAFDGSGRVSYASPAFGGLTGLSGPAMHGLDEATFSARLFERAAPGQAVSSLADVKRLNAAGVVVELMPPNRRVLELRLSQGEGGAVSQVLHLRDVTPEVTPEPANPLPHPAHLSV